MGSRIRRLPLETRKVARDDLVAKLFSVTHSTVDRSKMIDDDNNGFNCGTFLASMGLKKDMTTHG